MKMLTALIRNPFPQATTAVGSNVFAQRRAR